MTELEKFTKNLERSLTGWAFSLAILEDYCIVISEISGVSAEIIKERITKNANEKFKTIMSE